MKLVIVYTSLAIYAVFSIIFIIYKHIKQTHCCMKQGFKNYFMFHHFILVWLLLWLESLSDNQSKPEYFSRIARSEVFYFLDNTVDNSWIRRVYRLNNIFCIRGSSIQKFKSNNILQKKLLYFFSVYFQLNLSRTKH